MTARQDDPAFRWARKGRSCDRPEEDLDEALRRLYVSMGALPTPAPSAVRSRLRREYLRDRADFERVCWYVAAHAPGIRATLRAAATDPDASTLLAPEVLLVLERLHEDPFGLRAAWPEDQTVSGLLALADANARPLA